MIDFKHEVIKLVKEKLPHLIESSISVPPNPNMGDFALPCFPYAKEMGKSPVEIAKHLAAEIKPNKFVKEIKAEGPYLNFFINKEKYIEQVLLDCDTKKERFGSEDKKEETIVIDYGGPNVAKNMGIHNLRSTIIGQAIYNAFQFLGYNTVGVNHLGDWGTQFGKLIWALEKWSGPEELKEKGILFLNKIYVDFHKLEDELKTQGKESEVEKMEDEARAWFKRIEDEDKRAKMWWKIFVEISMEEYNAIYDRLGISFDSVLGESFYIQFLDDTIRTLEEKNLTTIDDGALVIKFDDADNNENMPPCLLRKRDGATLYGTRDIAAALYRLKTYNPSKILYVVDVAQSLHFKQWFKVMEMLDSKNKEKFVHISFGRLSFPDVDMSTRKGNIVPLKEVLDKAHEKSLEIIKVKSPELKHKDEVAEIVGVGAIIFGDLSNDRLHNVVFEWEKVLDFQGETAPYIQYTYARIRSILRKEDATSEDFAASYLSEPSEFEIVKKLADYNNVLNQVIINYKPSILARYIIELAQQFNKYYVETPILKEGVDENTKKARIFLISAVSTVIKSGMSLLCIKVPEKM